MSSSASSTALNSEFSAVMCGTEIPAEQELAKEKINAHLPEAFKNMGIGADKATVDLVSKLSMTDHSVREIRKEIEPVVKQLCGTKYDMKKMSEVTFLCHELNHLLVSKDGISCGDHVDSQTIAEESFVNDESSSCSSKTEKSCFSEIFCMLESLWDLLSRTLFFVKDKQD